jgi:serine/threonine protein kinase/tetratricopeptide (TPR) repeat protein
MRVNGRYELHEPIGSGGMGVVYRGVDMQTGEAVAVKLLKPEAIAADPATEERFNREAEALRQLNHPNIVKAYNSARENGSHYLVMEYVQGGSLRDLLAGEGRLPVEKTLRIALDLADALTRAHRLDIVHRDLKPANILMAEDGTPRLTDFGVAHLGAKERVTGTGVAVGTLDYLAPEALNENSVDARADIWAFGVLLYEMLTACRPFEGDTAGQVVTAILTRPVPDLEFLRPDCPPALTDLVYRMLEKDREARIPSVRLVGAELEAILRDMNRPTPRGGRHYAPASDSRFATPTPTADKLKNNIPAQTTAFIGREAELAELGRLLRDPKVRLVTILAPGGMGKTRLALEFAESQLTDTASTGLKLLFPNGVFYVPLAQVSEPDYIVSAIAEAMDFQFYQGETPKTQLFDFLRNKHLLLVLDNFEHIIDGAEVVSEILNAASNIKALATSRERLNLSGETLFNLGGMEISACSTREQAMEYSAVRLFLQSARRAVPDFELQEADIADVARICRLVEGTPLGLVLAAGWLDSLPLREVADEIEKSLDFLESELRDLPERQRSIRAVFDYSWNLLTPDERDILPRLVVFSGGFTREAAQTVTGVGLRGLSSLVNKSLLRRDPTSGRYDLHEMLRQYAAEQLDGSGLEAETRDRHAETFSKFLAARENDLKGRRQLAALDEIESEWKNITAAWDWAVERGSAAAVGQAAESLRLFSEMRGLVYQSVGMMERAYNRFAGVDDTLAGRLAARWARLMTADFQHESEEQIVALAERALATAKAGSSRSDEAFAQWVAGNARVVSHQMEAGIPFFEESLRLYRQLGDRYFIGTLLNGLAQCYGMSGMINEAMAYMRESMDIRRTTGDQIGLADSLQSLAFAAFHMRDFEESERAGKEAYQIRRAMNNRMGLINSLYGLSFLAMARGDMEKAQEAVEEMRDIAIDIHNVRARLMALDRLAFLNFVQDRFAEARAIIDEIEILSPTDENQVRYFGVNAVQGDVASARRHAPRALRYVRKHPDPDALIMALASFAQLLALTNQPARAGEILGRTFTLAEMMKDMMFNIPVVHRLCDRIQTAIGAEAFAAALERGQQREVDDLLAELAKDFGG